MHGINRDKVNLCGEQFANITDRQLADSLYFSSLGARSASLVFFQDQSREGSLAAALGREPGGGLIVMGDVCSRRGHQSPAALLGAARQRPAVALPSPTMNGTGRRASRSAFSGGRSCLRAEIGSGMRDKPPSHVRVRRIPDKSLLHSFGRGSRKDMRPKQVKWSPCPPQQRSSHGFDKSG